MSSKDKNNDGSTDGRGESKVANSKPKAASKEENSKPKAASKPKAGGKKKRGGGPVDPQLEHKRKISRQSSQRLRHREKQRFENLQTRQSDLTKANQALKRDNDKVRNQIEQVKQIIQLKIELAVNPNGASGVTADTLAAAAAATLGNIAPQGQQTLSAPTPSVASLPSVSASAPAGTIPPSVLLALSQVKSSIPHAGQTNPTSLHPSLAAFSAQPGSGGPASATAPGVDPPGRQSHSMSSGVAASLMNRFHTNLNGRPGELAVQGLAGSSSRNDDNTSGSTGSSGAAAGVLPSAFGAAAPAARVGANSDTADGINAQILQLLQSRSSTQPSQSSSLPLHLQLQATAAANATSDVNEQLSQLLHARSQQHQQAAAAMEQLRAMLPPTPQPPATAATVNLAALLQQQQQQQQHQQALQAAITAAASNSTTTTTTGSTTDAPSADEQSLRLSSFLSAQPAAAPAQNPNNALLATIAALQQQQQTQPPAP